MKKQILILVTAFLLLNITFIIAQDVPSPPNPDGTKPPTTPPATTTAIDATKPETWTLDYLKGLKNDLDKTLFPDGANSEFTEKVNQKISELWKDLDKDVKQTFVSKKLGIPKDTLKDIDNQKLSMNKVGDKWVLTDEKGRKLPLDNLAFTYHAGVGGPDNPKTTLMKDLKGITYFDQYGFRYEFSSKDGRDNHVYTDKGYIDKDGFVQGLTGFENNPISFKFPEADTPPSNIPEKSGGKIIQFGLATEEKDNPQKWGEGIHVWGKGVTFEVQNKEGKTIQSFRISPEDTNFQGQTYAGYGHLSLIDIKSEIFRARGDIIDSETGVQTTIPTNNALVILSDKKELPEGYKTYKQVNIFKNKDASGKEFLDISGTLENGQFLIPGNSESTALIKFPVESGKSLFFFKRDDKGNSEDKPFYAIKDGKEFIPRTNSGVTTQSTDGKTVTQNTQVQQPPTEEVGSVPPKTPTTPPQTTTPETQTPNPPATTPTTPSTPQTTTPETPATPPATTKPETPQVPTTNLDGTRISQGASSIFEDIGNTLIRTILPPAKQGENVAPPTVTTPPTSTTQTPTTPPTNTKPPVSEPPKTNDDIPIPETNTESKPPATTTQPPKKPPIRTNDDGSNPPAIAPPAAPPTNLDKSARWQVNPTSENPYYIFYA